MVHELKELLRSIAAPAYFFELETGRILAVNQPFSELMGYTEEELLALKVMDLRPEQEIPLLMKALRQAPPQGSVQWRYKTRAGKLLFVQITYRNSMFYDRSEERMKDIRMVVVSQADDAPVQTAETLIG